MEITEYLSIDKDTGEVWRKIRNIDSLPSIFSEIDRIDVIDEDKVYNVWFRVYIGPMERRFQCIATITQLVENKLVEFQIQNRHIDVECRIELEELDGGTGIHFTLRTMPKNPLGRLVDIILKDRIGNYRKRLLEYLT